MRQVHLRLQSTYTHSLLFGDIMNDGGYLCAIIVAFIHIKREFTLFNGGIYPSVYRDVIDKDCDLLLYSLKPDIAYTMFTWILIKSSLIAPP